MGDIVKYMKRCTEGIIISGSDRIYKKQGLKQGLNEMCVRNLSTFTGREKAAGILLNRKSILPIYVDESIVLFPTQSIRIYECVYINYQEMLTFKSVSDSETKIVFYDLDEIIVNATENKIKHQVLRTQSILHQKNNK